MNAKSYLKMIAALNYKVRISRGRFYFERVYSADPDDFDVVGRVTPLAKPAGVLLLEVESRSNSWNSIKQGKTQAILNVLSGDERGTFHGLGALDKSIREARKKSKNQLDRMKVALEKMIYLLLQLHTCIKNQNTGKTEYREQLV